MNVNSADCVTVSVTVLLVMTLLYIPCACYNVRQEYSDTESSTKWNAVVPPAAYKSISGHKTTHAPGDAPLIENRFLSSDTIQEKWASVTHNPTDEHLAAQRSVLTNNQMINTVHRSYIDDRNSTDVEDSGDLTTAQRVLENNVRAISSITDYTQNVGEDSTVDDNAASSGHHVMVVARLTLVFLAYRVFGDGSII